jgi:hypothetical protein
MQKRITAMSIVEVLLYMGLLTAIIISIGGFVKQIFSVRNKQQAVIEVENESMMVMSLLERDLKEASSITTPAAGTTAATLTYVKTSLPAYSRTYSLTSGALVQTTTPGAAVTLTSNRVVFSALSFNHINTVANSHVVTISFIASYSNPGGTNQFSYQKAYRNSIVLRPNQ